MSAPATQVRGAPARPALAAAALPWAALLAAFSPVLVDLARDLGLGTKHHYLALPALLLALALARTPAGGGRAARRPVLGALALCGGLSLELVGLAGEASFLARLGLPLAALGLGLLRGGPPPLPLALGFFLVPVPNAALALASPGLETALGRLAAATLSPLGLPVASIGLTLEGPAGAHLDLRAENGGALLAHCLAGVGALGAALGGAGWRSAAAAAALGAALALPLQPLSLLGAGALVAAGEPELARIWLGTASPVLASGAWLWWLRRAALARARAARGSA
jgi:hypothetical protein